MSLPSRPAIPQTVIQKYGPAELAESKAAYAALRETIICQAAKHNRYVFGVLLTLTMGCAALTGLSRGAWPALFALLFPLLWLKNPHRALSRSEYYSLPHSRFLDGKHRCISCGKKAVNRDNPNPQVALTSCAACGLRLFKGE